MCSYAIKWVSNKFNVLIVTNTYLQIQTWVFFELIFDSRHKFSILILSLARPWVFLKRPHQFFSYCLHSSLRNRCLQYWMKSWKKSKSAISTFGFTYDLLTWRKWTQKPLFFQMLPRARIRRCYEADTNCKAPSCTKKSTGHPLLTLGIFTLFCPHGKLSKKCLA